MDGSSKVWYISLLNHDAKKVQCKVGGSEVNKFVDILETYYKG